MGHETHEILTPSSVENTHSYQYDKFGNIIVNKIDDLIFDKFLEKNSDNKYKDLLKNFNDKNPNEEKVVGENKDLNFKTAFEHTTENKIKKVKVIKEISNKVEDFKILPDMEKLHSFVIERSQLKI